MSRLALQLSFRETVALVPTVDGGAVVRSRDTALTLREVTPGLARALRTLSSRAATEDELGELVLDTDGPHALARLYYYLECFRAQALLCFALADHDRALVVIEPMTGGFRPRHDGPADDARFCLSRFACWRREGSDLVLESPLSMARTVVRSHTGAALVFELARSRSCADLCTAIPGIDRETVRAFLGLLAAAGVITAEDADGTLAEDADPALAQWEFHDFLFHARSRSGRHDRPVGGTYPFIGRIPPLPALKPAMQGREVPLAVPDPAQVGQRDLPLSRVLEGRRSIRAYGAEPMTAAQLGEFLYRTVRVHDVIGVDPAQMHYYETSRRPYPSGGAAYDLELYVSVHRCTGLARGLYHYEPQAHRLRRLDGGDAYLDALLQQAQRAAVLPAQPQILITLTSRFQRLAWKYRGLAYATTLKNVGVLYQTMYLVATAMELAPCALGTGDAALFAEAIGTDYAVESSVGEFLLGSLPSGRDGSA